MAYLTLRTMQSISSVEQLQIEYFGEKPLSVNRIVVKDPVNNEVALFLPNPMKRGYNVCSR